jgi:hypothetical protein
MPQISHNMDYIHVMVAKEGGLTPGEFRLLSWEEQAEMIGFFTANQRIEQYYQEFHQATFERKIQEMEAQSKQNSKAAPRGVR